LSKKKKKPVKKPLQTVKKPARLAFLSYVGDVQGCGTIRVMYPYMLLNHIRNIPKVTIHTTFLSNYVRDADFYKDFTFVQFQRSATEYHLNIYNHFKKEIQSKYKIPLVYEIDDLLIGIPEWNYAHQYYAKNEKYVKTLISLSDGVITSTEKLKEIYSEYNNRIRVIPNHLPKFVWGNIHKATDYYDERKKVKILWAGSQNHFALPGMEKDNISGGDFGKGLMDFIRKTTDKYDWHLMGAMPIELEHIKNKITFTKWRNIFEYPKTMKAIEPDICIAPLEDSVFNACKSNIKSLEFAACGAPGIFSNVEPYKRHSMTADTDEEMCSMIEQLANDIDLRVKIYKKDYEKVRGQLFWEENNNVRKYLDTYLEIFGKRV
jgi:hypothetical protein